MSSRTKVFVAVHKVHADPGSFEVLIGVGSTFEKANELLMRYSAQLPMPDSGVDITEYSVYPVTLDVLPQDVQR